MRSSRPGNGTYVSRNFAMCCEYVAKDLESKLRCLNQ